MGKKKKKKASGGKRQTDWAEAKRLCRLNQQDVEMAKELGFSPRALIENIPSRSQPWKAPVKHWIRELHEKKKEKAAKKKRRQQAKPPADPEIEHVHEPPPDTGDDFPSDGTVPSDIPF